MLTIDSKELLYALSVLSDVVPSSSHMPILQNVYIMYHQDKVMLTGRSPDKNFTIYLNATGADSFEFSLPLVGLYGVVGQLAKRTDVINLSLDKGKRNLKLWSEATGSISLRLYPDSEPLSSGVPVSTKTAMAKIYTPAIQAIIPVFNFCGGDKVILNMVNLKSTGRTLKVEGTNGLIGGYVETNFIQGDKFNTTFPADLGKTLSKLAFLAGDDNYWTMSVTDSHTTFSEKNGQWVLTVKNSDTAYINLSRIYKVDTKTKLSLVKESLLDMLQMINHIGKTNNKITLLYKDKQPWLIANSDTGEAEVKISATEVDGDNIRISVHLGQLQKLIQQLPKDQNNVTLSVSSAAEPILVENKAGVYFIIPTL